MFLKYILKADVQLYQATKIKSNVTRNISTLVLTRMEKNITFCIFLNCIYSIDEPNFSLLKYSGRGGFQISQSEIWCQMSDPSVSTSYQYIHEW